VPEVLHAAVEAVGGEDRPGQQQMAAAVARAMATGEHLLVQAGTGTGKSLGYLVPAVLHHRRVVVATATLALQHQLVSRDIPAMLEAVSEVLGTTPEFAVLKGRSNFVCLHRIREGVPDDQGVLVDVPAGGLGTEVVAIREWAEAESKANGPGDRESAPSHTDRVWRQVSVSHRECLGAAQCPYGAECFAERAKEKAGRASLVVTNHSILAIDAIDGVPMIPDYDTVVVDEAHELVARVTQAATDELSGIAVDRAARRARAYVEGELAEELADASEALREAMDSCLPGRLDTVSEQLAGALVRVRDAARAVSGGFKGAADSTRSSEGGPDAARQQARAFVDDVRAIAERLAANSPRDVTWLADRDVTRGGNLLCVAPLEVWGQLRDRLFGRKTVVATSATLTLGGDFTAIATSFGLRPAERLPDQVPEIAGGAPGRTAEPPERPELDPDRDDPDDPEGSVRDEPDAVPETLPWRGVDVGSPFDYPRQAILYIARDLPAPGRDGIGAAQIERITAMIEALGGRTLGLFSSRRAAEAAAEAIRAAAPHLPVLCQGDGQLSHLRDEFVANPAVSLFGTLSLWQGLDVPGDTCQLVVIDRIPFPRPDDPVMSARAKAADESGRNGFMSVSATHAALLLAQGSGRLIRTVADRGVVAVLDPRLATARYGTFLRASLPPMWTTQEESVVLQALRRLGEAATAQR
jgi:ATP-dependent DNA helicase DinG